ncbi:hypothetical protein [Caballeronia calidae]|nr:hypothetical protein [Caballeronia calidae]
MEQPVSSGHTFSSETETQATFRSHANIQPIERERHVRHFLPSLKHPIEIPARGNAGARIAERRSMRRHAPPVNASICMDVAEQMSRPFRPMTGMYIAHEG